MGFIGAPEFWGALIGCAVGISLIELYWYRRGRRQAADVIQIKRKESP